MVVDRGRRRESFGSDADCGEIFLANSGAPQARHGHDHRAAAEFRAERRAARAVAAAIYIEGYHRPDYRSPDDQVYDAIADLMSNGRTSRLYRALVRDKQIASDSAGFTGYPGNKYPHLFAFYAFPIPGHKPQEIGRLRFTRRSNG